MSTTSNPIKANPESWEQHETQIRLEKADEFAKLSPTEQQKVLTEEKIKFEESKKAVKEKFGFKPFDPLKAKADKPTPEQEEADREKSLTKFEQSLHKSSDKTPKNSSPKEKELAFDEKRFYQLFEAADKNIKNKAPFDFQSVALNDFGSPSKQLAFMTKLTDYSQKGDLQPSEIMSRLKDHKANPNQITVRLEINMGEDQNNDLGLTNLSLEIPLAALMDGHLKDKLANFTNLVFFAALLHDQEKKKKKLEKTLPDTKPTSPGKSPKEESFKKFGITRVAENIGIQGGAGAFEQGDTSTVVFSCNNGSVWGTFDQHNLESDPKKLQEALDKNNLEK